ncbi:uncharacterized protein EI90DRAFT_258108 [Cantharellus anzutake]|uniref:uncharacterized protein n=1 Tax=Cantharellus anzutake TaxID=1750568 RepID=UPI001907107F|nr:uncharacterized protein EI90DRAFT_258108 [Cantharellus anzutake]KAF8335785.1 hypothetical protein EI90DRAFT_258108 [Cantharellus anzutake]
MKVTRPTLVPGQIDGSLAANSPKCFVLRFSLGPLNSRPLPFPFISKCQRRSKRLSPNHFHTGLTAVWHLQTASPQKRTALQRALSRHRLLSSSPSPEPTQTLRRSSPPDELLIPEFQRKSKSSKDGTLTAVASNILLPNRNTGPPIVLECPPKKQENYLGIQQLLRRLEWPSATMGSRWCGQNFLFFSPSYTL